ncbi:hypothetical protein AC578_10050 [Pseudocercospora eumusae]|uniref:RNase III domain-containing protein n=1 Tax=Pseudocercospora eumusae TaxID=321146 RepID=A0A139H870_9PEZI|nr:hypothetical protein AC578_10050 [Pseudocercospora eumusae]KXS98664.1 hypothetical protein AC578_10050 [Pseudocercospora eumusae]
MSQSFAVTKLAIKEMTGYEFQKDDLLKEALDTTGLRSPESNQRLAMLGDRLMGLIVTDLWYPTGAKRGRADYLLQRICNNHNLGKAGFRHSLPEHIVVHPGHRGEVSRKMVANTVEAILGAIWVDSEKDMEAVKSAMIEMELDPTGA